jgi:hypothetical protein
MCLLLKVSIEINEARWIILSSSIMESISVIGI